MLTKKLVAIILAGLLISPVFILNAQDDSIKQIQSLSDKKGTINAGTLAIIEDCGNTGNAGKQKKNLYEQLLEVLQNL